MEKLLIDEFSKKNELIQITKREINSNASYKRHHATLREEIEEILNKDDFKNTELELILEFIKNVDAFVKVIDVLKR